ncbi:hypothetical protein VNO78_09493 [Psophocarpus tetragonolobus]|uniref:Uncharacterized protein n=1 Tax=Psophocarpus tetragonolobus TaxID=3891 RepID=A0AAN9SZB4_PSOTE
MKYVTEYGSIFGTQKRARWYVLEMSPEKRKREKRREKMEKKKARVDEEEEIQEFYAILKRIQVAAKHIEKQDGAWFRRRDLTAAKSAWKPSFEVEDFLFKEDDGVKKDGHIGLDLCAVTERKGLGLDLNSEPKLVLGGMREDSCID